MLTEVVFLRKPGAKTLIWEQNTLANWKLLIENKVSVAGSRQTFFGILESVIYWVADAMLAQQFTVNSKKTLKVACSSFSVPYVEN